jgi:hypothetical protein
MLRVTIHLITAVAGTIIIYRSVPDIAAMVGEVFGGDGSRAAGFGPLQPGWYVFAFFLGLTPDVVINLSTSLAQWVAGSRSPKGDAFHRTKSVPLDVIDGVDFFIRFRLQQANIFEVQNLAVANPIMMFVETPFGVYQCVDWVAQAQLCTVVGADRFVALRRYNIRTIFDLERALLSVHSTSQMRRFVVSLMLTTPANEGDAGRWKGRDLGRTTQAASPAFTIGSEAFGAYVARLFSEQPEDDKGVPRDDIDATLKHLGRIVVDDLHVHRLRQIWRQVASRLDGAYDRLPDTERVGDAP